MDQTGLAELLKQVELLRQSNEQLQAELASVKDQMREKDDVIVTLQRKVEQFDKPKSISPEPPLVIQTPVPTRLDPLQTPDQQQFQLQKATTPVSGKATPAESLVELAASPEHDDIPPRSAMRNGARTSQYSNVSSVYGSENISLKSPVKTMSAVTGQSSLNPQEVIIPEDSVMGSTPRKLQSPRRAQPDARPPPPTSPLKKSYTYNSPHIEASLAAQAQEENEEGDDFVFTNSTASVDKQGLGLGDLALHSPGIGSEVRSFANLMDKKLSLNDYSPSKMRHTPSQLASPTFEQFQSPTRPLNTYSHKPVLPDNDSLHSEPTSPDLMRVPSDKVARQTQPPQREPPAPPVVSTPPTHSLPVPATPVSNGSMKEGRSPMRPLLDPGSLSETMVTVVSVLDLANPSKKTDEPTITLGVNFAADGRTKLLYEVKKTYTQLQTLDQLIRSFFALQPHLPDRSLFYKNTLQSVEERRRQLTAYFMEICLRQAYPEQFALMFAEFFSSDSNMMVDPEAKEGLLMKKVTVRFTTQWKVVHCSLKDGTLTITEGEPGAPQKRIALDDCTVEMEEDMPQVFTISEKKRKTVLFAETFDESREWVNALNQFRGRGLRKPPSFKDNMSIRSGTEYSDTTTLADDKQPPTPKQRKMGNLFKKSGKQAGTQSNISREDALLEIDQPEFKAYSPYQNVPAISQTPIVTQSLIPPQTPETMAHFTPTMEKTIFGTTISEALKLSAAEYEGCTVPSIVYRCLDYLVKEHAVRQEGIFRLTGLSLEIKSLQRQFDENYDCDFYSLAEKPDVHSISTLLKRYLRTLSQPLIPLEMSDGFNNLLKLQQTDIKKTAHGFQLLLKSLPEEVYNVLRVFLSFLRLVMENSDLNRMGAKNLSIMMSPNIGCDQDAVLELLLDYEYLFNHGEITPLDQRTAFM